MALSPKALRSFFSHLLDEVLERIFGFGFHLWLREPWSVLCRSPSEPLVTVNIEENTWIANAVEDVLERLCAEAEHSGNVRGFTLARRPERVTVVPLTWQTRSVVSPEAVASEVVVDQTSGLTWRPDGWKVYMRGMLEGLRDIHEAARAMPSPYLPLSLIGEHRPCLYRRSGPYCPETPAKWLLDPWAEFCFGVSDLPEEVVFFPDTELENYRGAEPLWEEDIWGN